MTARAVVTDISDEHVTEAGIHVYVHFVVVDPDTYPTQQPVVSAVAVVLDPTAPTNATWRAAVQAAVVAACAAMPDPFQVDPDAVAVPALS